MDIAFIVCSLLLFAFSVYIGFLIGNTVGVRAVTRADYWKMNGAAIVIAVLLSFILAAVPLFYSVDVGDVYKRQGLTIWKRLLVSSLT